MLPMCLPSRAEHSKLDTLTLETRPRVRAYESHAPCDMCDKVNFFIGPLRVKLCHLYTRINQASGKTAHGTALLASDDAFYLRMLDILLQ